MQESDIRFRFLIPPDQNTTEALPPSMRSFNRPTSRAFSSFLLNLFRSLAITSDMSHKSEFFQNASHFFIMVSFIQTHILLLLLSRFRSFYHNTCKSVWHHLQVTPICACDC